MHFSTLAATAAAVSLVVAGVIPDTHAVHEKRGDLTHARKMIKRGRVNAKTTLPMRVGLKQSNLDQGHDWLMDVTHPESGNYGKFWSSEDVIKAFQPSDEAVEAVRSWLVDVGKINKARITHSDNKAWLAFDATADEAEALLQTTFHHYEHGSTGATYLATDKYHVPRSLQAHIDYITPGVKGVKVKRGLQKRARKHSGGHVPFRSTPPAFPSNVSSLDTCDVAVTPACIRALYGFEETDPDAKVCATNAIGVFEEGDYYAQEDLDLFFANFTLGKHQIPQGTHPTLDSVDGGAAPVPVDQAGGESDLDFELIYPIVYPQSVTLYQTDDSYYAGTTSNATGAFNTFLDAIDGSYCKSCAFGECGNDPIDPTYPDTTEGGYTGQLQCGVFKPTNVISISYGGQEADLPEYYQRRQCNEYLKLGLQGVSIFFASGDDGVAGPAGDDSDNGCLKNGTVFSPSEPNSCPYVTNVGATKIYAGRTVFEPESAANDLPGHPHRTAFSSGGGFSNLFPVPKYQKKAIATYFAEHNPVYPYYTGGHYNTSNGLYNRHGRGIPDVAAVGDNIALFVGGNWTLEGGTSASTPIFAGIVNRIIEERIRHGKGPVGFINPVLYEHPWVLNDITNGSNPGCGTNGFDAVKGWDPVTGLGTPNYPKMLDLFLSLP